ncbi:MAG TPA: hypothetical protein DCY13_14045, partial [Verrucomicrobiales bacterium]|nr:hypothetical protein [Verrucomicrobiales bacterium]
KIAAVAQVGNPATPGTRYVFLQLQFLDGATPHPAYAVFHKPGNPADPGNFTRLAILTPTAHAPTLHALLERAAAAGFDSARLDEDLDGILSAGPFPSLAAKLSTYLSTDLPGGYDLQQREAMRRTHPQITLAEGRAYLARVPEGGPNTFEIRVIDPLTEVEGATIARVTSPAVPAILPAPAELSEKVETTPRGHLRTHLRWCLPQPLREMAFHWTGFRVFRVPRQAWLNANGAEPPINITRDTLLNAVASGSAIQVNRNVITVDESLPCPLPPGYEGFFMTDDNDSAAQQAMTLGSVEFDDGFESTYYVAAVDHFGRIGEPSPGLPVQICDRLPPATPSRIRVDNIYKQEGAPDHALRVSWRRDDPAEVARYHLYRFDNPDDAFVERASGLWPATPNRIAVIDNVGTSERISFADLTPGHSQLPADDGRTRWFVLVAEDATSCPSPAGYGNLSGASGPVPGALYDLAGPGEPQGRLRVPCCQVTINQGVGTFGRDPLRLTANRTNQRVAWVEFRDQLSGEVLGRHHFGAANQVSVLKSFNGPARFEARFGTLTGRTSAWVGQQPQYPGPSYPEHIWTGGLSCTTSAGCPGGFLDPVDPATGDLLDVCVEIAGTPADVRDVALFRRLGDDGPLVLQHRARVDTDNDGAPDLASICETAPPANPGRACYFIQYYDRNGNPSVVSLVGCVVTPGTEGFPTPNITHFLPANDPSPGQLLTDAAIAWFSPRPGVDRFEVALSPPPPGAAHVMQEGNEAGVGDLWGIVESPRLAIGFGNDTPNFAIQLPLESGKQYRARVRAVGPGVYDERDNGAWSDEAQIKWLLDPQDGGGGLPPDCPIPWPARAVPALITDTARELDAQLVNWSDLDGNVMRPATELWIRVGCFEFGEVNNSSQPGQTAPLPPRLLIDDLNEKLAVALPFTVYLHQTDPGSRGTMLQVSHYVDEILATTPAPGQVDIIDRAFAVRTFNPNEPPCLWFRVRHPLLANRNYRAAVVLHGEDREPVEVLRTRIVNASNPIQP